MAGMGIYVPTRKGARVANVFETNAAMSSPRRIVAKDCVGRVTVSTVFLCIDHSMDFGGPHEPVLWETMIFHEGSVTSCDEEEFLAMGYGPEEAKYLGQEQWRYASHKHAKSHHEGLVEMLRSGRN